MTSNSHILSHVKVLLRVSIKSCSSNSVITYRREHANLCRHNANTCKRAVHVYN